jgi:DNA-binding response OmpR family regulator
MTQVLVMTNMVGQSPLPALQLLNHQVTVLPLELASALTHTAVDLVCIDATLDLVSASKICISLQLADFARPVLVIMNDGGLAAITSSWGAADLILSSAGPAEIEARIRLVTEPRLHERVSSSRIHADNLVIDEASYAAKLSGKTLDLTFKEFELLRFFASNPSRVFTREQLLSEVWGYDYFGGTRTVDVHVRRLRAKLGEHEQMIGTVRNVGYQFVVAEEHDDVLQPQS